MLLDFDKEAVRQVVALQKEGSGYAMGKIQRVSVGALALETFDPAAISSLIGIDQTEVANVLRVLLKNGWDTMEALEEEQLNDRVDMTSNDNRYAILNKQGVKE